MTALTALHVKKSRFRDNIRRLLKERGWTQAFTAETANIPLPWLERVCQHGLARQQKQNQRHLAALLKVFGFKSINAEVFWNSKIAIPAFDPISDEKEFHQATEYLRVIYADCPRRVSRRVYRLLEAAAAQHRTKHDALSLRGKRLLNKNEKAKENPNLDYEIERRLSYRDNPHSRKDQERIKLLATRIDGIAEQVADRWPRAFQNRASEAAVLQMINDFCKDEEDDKKIIELVIDQLKKSENSFMPVSTIAIGVAYQFSVDLFACW